MNEQAILLFFLILATAITLFLYLWKAKKHMEYRQDERWQFVQNKANAVAKSSNYILILLLFIGDMVAMFSDVQVTFTLNRISTYVILFIGLTNAIELFALKYFDRKL